MQNNEKARRLKGEVKHGHLGSYVNDNVKCLIEFEFKI